MNSPKAFPNKQVEHHYNGQHQYILDPGMTLLDYFAGQALAGLTADPNVMNGFKAAEWCYDYAEAMLEEREKRMQKGENDDT